MVDKQVIEWAPFRLRQDVDETQLLAASTELQEHFLGKQKGLVRRELLRREGREWVDLVVWENLKSAQEAGKNAASSPACFEYFRLMDGEDHSEPGAGVLHLERVRTYLP